MVSRRRAPPPKRIRTTFGPRKAGFIASEPFTSDSAADNVPPAARRPPPARTPLRKVRRGTTFVPLIDPGISVVISRLPLEGGARRSADANAHGYNTR